LYALSASNIVLIIYYQISALPATVENKLKWMLPHIA